MFSVTVFAITALLFVGTLGTSPGWDDLPPMPKPEDIVWPKECENLSYCSSELIKNIYPTERFEKILENLVMTYDMGNPIEDRSKNIKDVAGCVPNRKYEPIYLIKDEEDRPRFVAHTNHTQFLIQIQECKNVGVVRQGQFLDKIKLSQKAYVFCHERKVPILFPVLALSGTAIESVSPKGGISVSCSAKIIKPKA